MKKFSLCILLIPFSFLITIAQNALPPVYEIKTDTAFEQSLTKDFYQVLEDNNGKWTIEQVSHPPLADKFHYQDEKLKDADTIVPTHWFRYRLKNLTGHEINIALNAWGDQADFYIWKGKNKWDHFLTGHLYPWSKKNGIKETDQIPVFLSIGAELLIYYRTHNTTEGSSEQYRIDFFNTYKLIEPRFKDFESNYIPFSVFQFIFFFGFYLLAAVFNFLIFLTARDKVYLYFSLFLVSMCFINNPLFTVTLYREHFRIALFFQRFGLISFFFLLWFTRYYFKTFRLYPSLDKFLIAVSFIELIDKLINALTEAFTLKVFNLIPFIDTAFFLILVSVIIFFLIKRPGPHSKIFAIAVFPFVIQLLVGLTLLPFIHSFSFQNWMNNWGNLLLGISNGWLVLVFSWFLFKQYSQMQRDIGEHQAEKERLAKEKEIERSQLIEQQKIELEKTVEERTAELKHSLENLQSTQKQLIQSEKMASLGELTAGIAHEIQNPLNFVNNFSEVNKELIAEMKEEIKKGNLEEVNFIANDIEVNEEKINQHGKRADAIVKGMLQHSQSSSGIKEPTDINKLADEYLRLAYHGLRAKDKTFNATLQTDFDETIGKINIIPQDIGRVLLNLYNNAFYAVSEKKKQQGENYEPTVSVSTKKVGDKVLISVKDNGNGIPQKIVDKIFQPFFTTKPTGQGTGLGLLLAYDIVKAHGGEIKVETKEGDGAEFIILLPFNIHK